MKPTRTTQPYRPEGGREPGPALDAMLRGRSLQGYNPMDVQRDAASAQAETGDSRPARPPRAARAPRPPRPYRG